MLRNMTNWAYNPGDVSLPEICLIRQSYPDKAGVRRDSIITFLGATGNGTFPKIGEKYFEMHLSATEGRNQTFVFAENKDIQLVSLIWETDGKRFLREGTMYPISNTGNGLQANIDGTWYVTNPDQNPGEYRVVDPVMLLRYFEKRISRQELDAHAESLLVEDKRDVKLRDNESLVKSMQSEIEQLNGQIKAQSVTIKELQVIQRKARQLYRFTSDLWIGFDKKRWYHSMLDIKANAMARSGFTRPDTLLDNLKPE